MVIHGVGNALDEDDIRPTVQAAEGRYGISEAFERNVKVFAEHIVSEDTIWSVWLTNRLHLTATAFLRAYVGVPAFLRILHGLPPRRTFRGWRVDVSAIDTFHPMLLIHLISSRNRGQNAPN